MIYLIDSWAWIEYLVGTSFGEKAKTIIENTNNEIITCSITVAEIASIFTRQGRDFKKAYEIIDSISGTYLVEDEISAEAGILHAEIRKKIKDFGLTDAYLLAIARKINAKIITGDLHFKNFKEAIMITEN